MAKIWKSHDDAARKLAAEQAEDFRKTQESLSKAAKDLHDLGRTDAGMATEMAQVDHHDKHGRGENGAIGR